MPDFDRVDRRVEKLPDLRAVLTAPRVAAAVDALLATIKPKQRFFLFVHLYDPHGYYVRNPLFDFGRRAVERYDAEVAFTDHWLQQIMDRIAAQVGGENLAFIVTADHGEEFDDHRYASHGHRLYEETLRVPLIVSAPGIGTRRIDRPVGSIDVDPTVLHLLGVEPPAEMPGRSLLTVETPPVRPVFAWIGTKRAVITERDKLIWDEGLGLVELYDLRSDPAERHNLADLRPDRVDELYCLRRQHLKALSLAPPPPAPRPPPQPDPPQR